KVYVTVENIDAEAVSVDESPLCIVRDGDYNAELSDYSRNADVINYLQDGIFEEAYLDPGATESGWLTFQIKPDEKELIMKYDQLFDTVFFRFTVDTSATTESTAQQPTTAAAAEGTPATAAAGGTENESVVDYTGFSIDEIMGTYNVAGMGKSLQIELFTSDDMLILRFSDGTEVEYEYDLVFGVATRYAEFDDGHTVLTILTFTRGENTIYIAIDESLTYADGTTKTGSYEGSKID
ncbi:MAG TPA: hypothetical protein DD735_01955, partial [Clostridiales bacterium]|nr:hypothetical protein [Clostridiales bacterium]